MVIKDRQGRDGMERGHWRLSRRRFARTCLAGAASALVRMAPTRAATQDTSASQPDLSALNAYLTEQVGQLQIWSAALVETAQAYYDRLAAYQSDYAAAWANDRTALADLITKARDQWRKASTAYEMSEGLVAGVPSLAYFDTLLDAGPSGTEDPKNALDWKLTLPDGRVLDKPGNLFHSLTEPALWGTEPAFVGMQADLDGDGQLRVSDVLPEANVVLGSVKALSEGANRLADAVGDWEPTIEDAFTALVTMLPTMSDYFEEWKQSAYVAGANATEASFVGQSRLVDISGIINGLDVTYDALDPVVSRVSPDLSQQIDAGFARLASFISDLLKQEQAGKRFTGEEADLLGAEAQNQAATLAGLVSQAIALLGVQVGS
ncbi:MAG: EfeM/EfeO family lipoprotein [Chloroflexota bacterium]